MRKVSIPGFGSFCLSPNESSRLDEDGTAVIIDHGNRRVSSIVAGIYQLASTSNGFESLNDAVIRFLSGAKTAQLPASIERIDCETDCCSAIQAVSPRIGGGIWVVRACKCSVIHQGPDFMLISVNGDIDDIKETAFPVLYSMSPHSVV